MRNFILAMLMLLACPPTLHAHPDDFDYSAFAHIPVLHEGRIKPLDSFARVMLRRISGESAGGNDAAQWLSRVLFAPSAAMNEHIFSVHSSELVHALLLPVREGGRYSFSELAAMLTSQRDAYAAISTKNKKNLSAEEQELLSLYTNVSDFAVLTGSFSLLTPLPYIDGRTRHLLGGADDAPVTYLTLMRIRKDIQAKEKEIRERKKDHIDSYTPDELDTAELNARLLLTEVLGKNNALLRVIPPFWEGSDEWLSPWAVIEKGVGSPQSARLFGHWQALAAAYRQGDASAWKELSHTLLAAGQGGQGVRPWALALEVDYNALNLLNLSFIAYALGFLLAVAGLLKHSRRWLTTSYTVLCGGMIVHGVALAMRIALLARPPVSTLYESMIFVSFIAAAFGLWLERSRKEADGLLIGGIIACLLLAAANMFAGSNDTLEVLVAVLNTNFWLATHVVCITTGYGSSLVAGMLAHLYLFKRATDRKAENDLIVLQRRLYAVALVALLFTAVGTMLGGIWADQSWGRFWGWDPKENGALWIVLWLIWLLHARVAGQVGVLGFAVGMAFINIVVALAWVGVNLLSVGLHSYGFTDAAANGLLVLCMVEFVFIVGAAYIARSRALT